MKKLVISIIVIVVAAASFITFTQLNKNDPIGEITITVIDEIGDTLYSRTYEFTEDDTLFSILDSDFIVGCADSSYNITLECEEVMFGSRVIMRIEDIETDWTNTYIAIYENDEYSLLGIDSIVLNDGDTFTFKYQEVGGDN